MSKFNILIVCTIILFVISYFIYWDYKIYYYNIDGVIKKIIYNDKGYPNVIINNEEYGLPFGKDEIKVGDSLVKKSKSNWVYQYRNNVKIDCYEW